MEIQVRRIEDAAYSYEQVANLLHEAFEERVLDGMDFSCSKLSASDIKKKAEHSIILVAYDASTAALLGTATTTIRRDKRGVNYAYHENLGIASKYKRCGIGTLLLKELERIDMEYNIEYILSTTSVKATSSILWHKKNGFLIYGYGSDSENSYYSYLFRKQLNNNSIWSNKLFVKAVFCLYYVGVRLGKKENGKLKPLGLFLIKVKRRFV